MNLKKHLESRILGWFPHEPKLNLKCQVNSETPQTPLDLKMMARVNANKLRPVTIILIPLIVLGICVSYRITTTPHYVFNPTGLIAGALSGTLVALFFIGRDLHILAKKGKVQKSRKLKLLIALSLNYPWIISFVTNIVFFQTAVAKLIPLEFTLTHILSYGILFTAMNLIWENLSKKRLYFVANGGLYAIPQTEPNPKS